MSAVCTNGPNQDVPTRMLDASSIRLQTDHLDVWQIYEVIYHNDEVEALRAEERSCSFWGALLSRFRPLPDFGPSWNVAPQTAPERL
jgi:hypothetical protein